VSTVTANQLLKDGGNIWDIQPLEQGKVWQKNEVEGGSDRSQFISSIFNYFQLLLYWKPLNK